MTTCFILLKSSTLKKQDSNSFKDSLMQFKFKLTSKLIVLGNLRQQDLN